MTATIHKYWNDRAASNRDSPAATTNDIHLRTLEARAIARELATLGLPSGACVLDLGCGDGLTTISIARATPTAHFVGIDFADKMIDAAVKHARHDPSLAHRVRFVQDDVTVLKSIEECLPFTAAFSCRCLINLETCAAQRNAMQRIARVLAKGGMYFAIENFTEGQDAMNAARDAVGLPPIPIRWHNRFFTQRTFAAAIEGCFHLERIEEFASAYYLATRVLYSRLCQQRGEEPNYDHDIHRIAVDLPLLKDCLSPVRLAVLRKL